MEIDLPSGRRVSPSAAFGPGIIALSEPGYGVVSIPSAFALMLLGEVAARFIVRRTSVSLRLVSLRIAAFVCGWALFIASVSLFAMLEMGSLLGLLVGACMGSSALFGFDTLVLERDLGRGAGSWWENGRSGLPLLVVMASTAGLLVLAYPHLGWTSFVLTLIPVAAVRYEFNRYRLARETYDQTIRALSALTEGAGYVPAGHHRRVAEICVAMARTLGMSPERIGQLELVALLHDVGTVSLPDPADVATASPLLIARRGGQVLKETGYLAEKASVLTEAAGESAATSLEGRVLQVADAYDQLEGMPREDRLGHIAAKFGPQDAAVLDALTAATAP